MLKSKLAIVLTFTLMVAIFTAPGPAANGAASLEFKSPTDGDLLNSGTLYPIIYQANDVSIYRIEFTYTTDHGTTWYPLFSVDNPNWNVNEYYWAVPETAGSNCFIRARCSYPATDIYYDSDIFTIYVTNGEWHYSSVSNMQPLMPTDVKASVLSGASIQVSWKDNASDENCYILERQENGTGNMRYLTSLPANTVTYEDNAVETGKSYKYRLKASNNNGESCYSQTAEAELAAIVAAKPPVAPKDLTATATSSTSIELAWKDIATDEDSYIVEYRRLNLGSWVEVETLAAGSTSCTDTGLVPERAYEYRVKAVKAGVASDYSNIANATTLKGPATSATGTIIMKFYPDNTMYYVNNKLKTMDTAPVNSSERLLLPIHYVAEPLGASSDWDDIEKKATIMMNDITIELWLDQSTALVNGVETPVDPDNLTIAPVATPSGQMMLPLRFVTENLGCGVSWDPSAGCAVILYEPAGLEA